MAVTINASTSAGLISSADTSGVLQLQTANTTALTIDASQNVGLGVTPSAWVGYKVLQAGIASFAGGSSGAYLLQDNAFTDNSGAGWKYINSGYAAAQYYAASGAHVWRTAPSGTAGNAITFTQAMTLNASGNLGVGTTSPTTRLTVSGSSAIITADGTTNNGARGLDLVYSGQSYGSLLNYAFTGETALTAGYTGSSGYFLTFKTENVERARIDSSGNLLVNLTSAPTLNGNTAGKFAVASGTAQVGLQDNGDGGIFATYSLSKSIGLSAGSSYGGGAGQAFIKCTPTTGSSSSVVVVANTNGVVLSHNATSWASNSDLRLKNVISTYTNALADIAQIQPIKFTWKSDTTNTPCVGVIAQSVQSVIPEAVSQSKSIEGDETEYLQVRYTELIPLMIAAIQEQQALIETLTQRITVLEGA
jgi:hypothetical protein